MDGPNIKSQESIMDSNSRSKDSMHVPYIPSGISTAGYSSTLSSLFPGRCAEPGFRSKSVDTASSSRSDSTDSNWPVHDMGHLMDIAVEHAI
ncbi:hypothetical protein Pdw03_0184 [Penicillium digitatum]|uniref:Uncharacterized protein n=1 Tax=Penicillium digitatum TaxID=36651 RepID=A0A7T7BMJ1_PENDI|nr:hypothetical protein Pdw03_0184 [Penicillium digitatum]